MIREDFLQQFAFDAVDAYCPPQKAYWILKTILAFNDAATQAMSRGVSLRQVLELTVLVDLSSLKTTPLVEALEKMPELIAQINEQIAGIEVL
jgi:V/A-type H+-transporting ATPase subunit A